MNPITASNTAQIPILLGDLAFVRQGYHFRKKVTHDPLGNISVVQSPDISQFTTVIPDRLSKVNGDRIKTEYHLAPKSILVKSRGTNYSAALFDLPGVTAVAAYHFIVVTVTSADLLPEFLLWFINRRDSQDWLSARSRGSYVKAVSAKALADLPIIVPPMQQQHLIVKSGRLANQESIISSEISAKRNLLTQTILESALAGPIRTEP
ncbi:MAG: restriction endonuclease subunit S [Candidatus Marinimicrobia bacterium]|nr:restriction endonuclease subunit S [Candidatus Neomarinimicrobiota bacterium]